MANIRVYELARDLNMKNKALLDKLSDMEISVRSHMSSLDDKTVDRIKAHLLGNTADGADTTRVKPTVIRRRRKRPAKGQADTAKENAASEDTEEAEATSPETVTEAETEVQPEEPPDAIGPEETGSDLAEAESEIAKAAPGKAAGPVTDSEPEAGSAEEMAETAKKAPEAPPAEAGEPENGQKPKGKAQPKKAKKSADRAAVIIQKPVPPESEKEEPAAAAETGKEADESALPSAPEEKPAEASSEAPLEDLKAAEAETEAPEAEKPNPEAGKPDVPETAAASEDDARESADETSDPGEKSSKKSETEEKGKAEPEKPAKESSKKKKRKKVKKDMPARIIKLPPEPPPEAKTEKTTDAVAASSDSGSGTEKKAEAESKDQKRKKGKKAVEATEETAAAKEQKGKTERGEKGEKENRWAKKKISFKRKEVVEGKDLYSNSGRGRRGRKGQKAKPAPSQKTQITTPKAIKRRIKIDDTIMLSDLAKRMGIKANDIIMKLMGQGMMVTVNQTIDFETAILVAAEFGYGVERASFEEETLIKAEHDDPEKLTLRPPVVTIMGHVDHGKTSLLDMIRKTRVTDHEAGGITQHIGAYYVETDSGQVVFLDTPGHEAFTAMRARGATVTDIVVLVVAADDGVMPQTVEAINHARAAQVPIIVAVNKIDKNNANMDRVYRELSEQGLVPEDWGGDTIFVKVSAKQNIGIEELLEMILLQSEVLELKANPEKHAVGYVVEAKLDAGRGPVATILVQEGSLHAGDSVVCGIHYGKIRAMLDDLGQAVDEAGPSIPVEILGLSGVPNAGDELVVLEDEKSAKQVSDHRVQKQRSVELAKTSRLSLDKLFEKMQEGEVKDLNLIIKADVHGSIEALKESLIKLSNNEVAINVIHAATGTITESDISLAAVSDAIIIGFNVRAAAKVDAMAAEEHVDIRYYNVIYNAIKDVQDAILGMMSSTYEERVLGRAEVRQTFHVPRVGTIAGCYVTGGKIERNGLVRLLREGVVLYEGKIASLKRFKEDTKEVASGYECGINVENYNDVKMGDVIECYYMEEIKPEL